MTPDTRKPGAVYVTTGENLDKGSVKELFLTLDKEEIRVVIISRKAGSIEFRLPVNVKPGRYGWMILNADCTMHIEQPVKLIIE